MIKKSKKLAEFELEQVRAEKIPYCKALKIVEAMWQEGLNLKVLPPENHLEGIETDIRIARILNSLRNKPTNV
jgi:hypothetical protein